VTNSNAIFTQARHCATLSMRTVLSDVIKIPKCWLPPSWLSKKCRNYTQDWWFSLKYSTRYKIHLQLDHMANMPYDQNSRWQPLPCWISSKCHFCAADGQILIRCGMLMQNIRHRHHFCKNRGGGADILDIGKIAITSYWSQILPECFSCVQHYWGTISLYLQYCWWQSTRLVYNT